MPEKHETNSTNTDSGLLKPSSGLLHGSDLTKSGLSSRLLIKFSTIELHHEHKGSNEDDDDNNNNNSNDNNHVRKQESPGNSSKKNSFDPMLPHPEASSSTTFRQVLPLTSGGRHNPIASRVDDLTTATTIILHSEMENPKAIKIHTGFLAKEITTLYNADALTIGKNIFFSAGKLDLASPRGLALFAHELTHIMQQEEEDDAGLHKGPVSPSRRASLEKQAQEKERDVLEYFNFSSNNLNQSKVSTLHHHQRQVPFIGSFANIDFVTHHPYRPQDLLLRPSFHHDDVGANKTGMEIAKSESLLPMTEKEGELGTQSYNHPDRIAEFDSKNAFILQNSAGIPEEKQSNISNLVFAAPLKQQQAISDSSANVPFTAERGRPVESKAATTPPPTPSMPASPSSTLDLNRLAEQVYEIIERKIKMQRDRTGFR